MTSAVFILNPSKLMNQKDPYSPNYMFTDCKPRHLHQMCYKIKDRKSCLTSMDIRPKYMRGPCGWCLGKPCSGNTGNRCEPIHYLQSFLKLGDDYEDCYINTSSYSFPNYELRESGKILSNVVSIYFLLSNSYLNVGTYSRKEIDHENREICSENLQVS